MLENTPKGTIWKRVNGAERGGRRKRAARRQGRQVRPPKPRIARAKWRIARDTCIPVDCRNKIDRIVVMRKRTGQDVLEHEILEEQAATIGRLARELRDALDALDAYNGRASSGETAADSHDPQRARLVDAAAYALWNFVVQRECSGFRRTEQLLKDYAVPVEVRAKMGAVRPR